MPYKRKVWLRNSLICILVLQIFLIFLLSQHIFLFNRGTKDLYGFAVISTGQAVTALLFLSISLLSLSLYIVCELFKMSKLEVDLSNKKVAQELTEQNLRLLRCQRHDFLNHLQVVSGYIQMGKANKATKYIQEINQSLRGVRVISGLNMPEASVLLLSKREEAANYDINFNYDLKTDLSNVKIKEYDLVRILSNLIDNAIYELKKSDSPGQKNVNIVIDKVEETLYIEIFNSGSFIPDTQQIFNYGFTTKGNNGSGFGLYIVKDLVKNKYNGNIDVESSESLGTNFKISI